MKKKLPKVDGFGPIDVKKIRTALRQVWHRSHPRKIAVARAVGRGGYSYCEKCRKRAPKVYIDHIKTVGELDGGFMRRLFCPSKGLQALCKKCHDEKTREERKTARLLKSIGIDV